MAEGTARGRLLLPDLGERDVEVSFDSHNLHIVDLRDGQAWRWPLHEVQLLESVRPGRPVRFGGRGEGTELRLDNGVFVRTLRGASDHLRSPRRSGSPLWVVGAYIGGAAALAIVLLVTSVEVLPGMLVPVIPSTYANKLGERVYEAVFADAETCADPDGKRALEDLANRLWRHSPRRGFVPVVTVVNAREVNAVALPGGHILLFRGLLERVEHPDALAGVLAHEMGHEIEQHGLHNLVRSSGLAVAGSILSSGSADGIGVVGELGGLLAVMSYGREAEQEADRWAVELLVAAGGSTLPLADLMAGFEAPREGDVELSFLRSHPHAQDRSDFIRAADPGADRALLSDAEWMALRSICAGTGRPTRVF